MFDDIVELEMWLQEAAGNIRVKPRTADIDDALKLLEEGRTYEEISKRYERHYFGYLYKSSKY